LSESDALPILKSDSQVLISSKINHLIKRRPFYG